jgi:hypothetical protein
LSWQKNERTTGRNEHEITRDRAQEKFDALRGPLFWEHCAAFIAGPNAALAASPQHYDQAPNFYRLKVGDLEVTMIPAYSIRTG